MTVKIRKPDNGDYTEVKKMIQSLHNLHQTNRPDIYVDREIPFSIDDFNKLIEEESSIVLLAEIEGEVIGICMATIKEPSSNPILLSHNIAYIDDIYVENEHRGKGVGKMLFTYIEEILAIKKIERIDLTVWTFNKDAISFYERLGMKPQRVIMEKKS